MHHGSGGSPGIWNPDDLSGPHRVEHPPHGFGFGGNGPHPEHEGMAGPRGGQYTVSKKGKKRYTGKAKQSDHEKLKAMTEKLYDAKTPAHVRKDLSMKVAMLRSKMGHANIDQMIKGSGEEQGD